MPSGSLWTRKRGTKTAEVLHALKARRGVAPSCARALTPALSHRERERYVDALDSLDFNACGFLNEPRRSANGGHPLAIRIAVSASRTILRCMSFQSETSPVMQGLVALHRAFSSFNQISVSNRRNWTSLTSTSVPRALSFRALAIASSIVSRSISFSSAATISAFPAPALRSISSRQHAPTREILPSFFQKKKVQSSSKIGRPVRWGFSSTVGRPDHRRDCRGWCSGDTWQEGRGCDFLSRGFRFT